MRGSQDVMGQALTPHPPVPPLQFDNFKRVFKAVEELRGPLVDNIQQHFLLPDRLARYRGGLRGAWAGREPQGCV